MFRRLVAAAALICLSACAPSAPAVKAPGILVETPWVRTTDGATNTMMTALFVSLSNPGSKDITLTSADCSSVAGKTELHEMVKGTDGKMLMQEAKGGIVIPKESHVHLTPGGYHVMLMQLKQALPVGQEVKCTLTFSDGVTKAVTAPVKEFTEEEDHYHSPSPVPSTPKG